MGEVWKDIQGFENVYMVSNFGRVRSFYRGGTIMRQRKIGRGYPTVSLFKNNSSKNFRISRLVAKAFIQNIYNKPQVNHIDGNKENNYADNLEWNTNSENNKHAFRIGLKIPTFAVGVQHTNAKLSDKKVRVIKYLKNIKPKITQRKIAEIFGVSTPRICNIWKNRDWKHIKI